MPGTKDLAQFDSPKAGQPLVDMVLTQIRHSWGHGEGMAVQGEGREALDNLYRTRVEKQERSEVPAGTPVSLAFYTGGTGWLIHLQRVTRQGNTFTIQYRTIPYHEAESSSHLALIPVGKLPSGKYRVKVEKLPMDQKYLDDGFRRPTADVLDRISGSFTFIVIDRR
jgi:hypothetical protein